MSASAPVTYSFRTPPDAVDREKCARLARGLNIPFAVAHLLCQRGMTTMESAGHFLFPKLADLPSPFAMKGMADAVQIILRCFRKKHPVIIHGDYDVDGISATVLLTGFLRRLGMETYYHLPDRLHEGYGINKQSLARLAAQITMPGLLITVDCGISSVEEIAMARELGFDVIVTDHHEPPAELPGANVILNPKQSDCSFPFTGLSGAGVAFFLAMALRSKLVDEGVWSRAMAPNLKEYLDLVALGTVADVMPLTDVNRILVRAGLEVLTTRTRPGIWALCELALAGLSGGRVTAEDISFRLAPRLNAAGRLGRPQISAELLLCDKVDQALKLAYELEQANDERRELEAAVLNEAFTKCENMVNRGYLALTVYGKNWHPGVIGIIASRVTGRFHRPAIIFTDDTEQTESLLKGSGRSVEGLNLYQALKDCTPRIVQYGGHTMAIGLTVQKADLEAFRELFDRAVRKQGLEVAGQQIVVDFCLTEHEMIFTPDFFAAYQNLEPFGEGNPEPVFLIKNRLLHNASPVKDHLKFTLRQDNLSIRGIGFGLAYQLPCTVQPVNLFFKLKNSTFRGREFMELHAVSISSTD